MLLVFLKHRVPLLTTFVCSQKIKTCEEGSNAVWSLLNASLGHGQSEKELSKKVAQPRAGSKLDQWSLEQAYAFFFVC